MNSACPGCGVILPVNHGPTHAYIGASPACWAVYCEVLAREYGEFAYPPVHRWTVDAYAAQHPGVESRRSIQSVAGHLIALYLLCDRARSPDEVRRAIGAAVARPERFVWLQPPTFVGTMNVTDIAGTGTLEQHTDQVHAWARSVWGAWHAHHDIVREWARE